MENLFTGLILAAVTGLGIFAYRHPEGYKTIFKILHYVAIAVVVCAMIWNIGLSVIFLQIVLGMPEIINMEERKAINVAMDATQEWLKIPFLTTFIIYVAFEVYIIVLSFLPDFMNKGSKESDSKNKEKQDEN